jgi:hypothetical protein
MPELTEGTKYDMGKIRYDLIPPECLEELAKVYTGGASKYDDWNWAKGIKYSRVYGALMRHVQDWYKGGEVNHDDFDLHLLAHVAWNAFTLLYYELHKEKYEKFDDRRINNGYQNSQNNDEE